MKFKTKYALMSLRASKHLFSNPLWTLKITYKRAGFFFTKRFVGKTIVSPEGDPVFNNQSLILHWALFSIDEMGYEWQNDIRESFSPNVWDIGANIGTFGRKVLSLNPGARITAVEPWPNASNYNRHAQRFFDCASGDKCQSIELTFQDAGLHTASTASNFYSGHKIEVQQKTLDSMWNGEEVDLLKIDVDGAEESVFAGAKEMLKKTKSIIVEINSKQAFDNLPKEFKWTTTNNHDWYGKRI
jgi:FkbM family methyltransferase